MKGKQYNPDSELQELNKQLAKVEKLRRLRKLDVWKQVESVFEEYIQLLIQDVLNLCLKDVKENEFEIAVKRSVAEQLGKILSALNRPETETINIKERIQMLLGMKKKTKFGGL